MIRLGSWSSILLVFAGQAVVLALLLLAVRENRLANRYLAALLLVIAGLLTPFILGYAGAYDAWPWLSFAPFAVPLAVGPLLYGHVRALARGRPIGAAHFVPAALQFGYQAVMFATPLATKAWFNRAVEEPWLGAVTAAAVLASMAGYTVACWRELKQYDDWLRARRRHGAPARRLRIGLSVLVVLLAARAAYQLFEALVRPTDYFDLFGYYVLLGLTGCLLGIEGWRMARAPAPPIAAGEEEDWASRGAQWIDRLRRERWWTDPELGLAGLARALGTNSSHLSRALAPHGGFAAVVARLRVEAVAAWIDAGRNDDLLTLALDAGFGSKASFNRAFRAHTGMTPSAYRVAAAKSLPLPAD